MKSNNKQVGSAHVVIIIILVIAVIGLLGFVFWQNFISKKTVAQTNDQTQNTQVETTKNTPSAESANAISDTNELTFEYPKSGWKEIKGMPDAIVEIDTNDYVHNQGMGLAAGSSIVIGHTTQQEVPQGMGEKDIQSIEIDKNKGYKYEMDYEGYRLQAFFTAKNITYLITMETTTTPTDNEKQVFDLVLSTLHIK